MFFFHCFFNSVLLTSASHAMGTSGDFGRGVGVPEVESGSSRVENILHFYGPDSLGPRSVASNNNSQNSQKNNNNNGPRASRCLHWHIFYFCFPWEIFSAEFMGSLRPPPRLIPVHMSPGHSICSCFNSYKIFYANLAVYCCRLWLTVWNVTNFPQHVRVRVPVSWEIIQQFSHLLFGPASFPLRPQFSPDLLPQLWASVFIYLFFRQLSSSLTYSLQGKMKYSQVHPKFLSSPLTKFGSHARERRNILIFPLLISESVGNWLNMQI